jgi:homopolymeric O-antigen transport system ATP-binding protein
MSNIAIRVDRLFKQYKIGLARWRHDTLRDQISHGWSSLFRVNGHDSALGSESNSAATIWALKDVSFEINHGEVMGIIGRNGAGKSTLLKILSRITEPTAGRAEIFGRVGSLLEVGTGFHQELTGRENIYLNGAILGMKKWEIDKKFDEIVAFSEVDQFIDTPVKRYSSGMHVRLAFAVAAHLDPEILIVDEVLAVGDAAFQKKCLGKMDDVAKGGRTVLLVSHNMQVISTLTNRAILFSGGRCVYEGKTAKAITKYLREDDNRELVYKGPRSPGEPRITFVELHTSEPGNVQINGDSMEVRVLIHSPRPIGGAAVSFQARNSMQQPILHLWTFDSERPMCRDAGVYELVCRIPKVRLYLGRYDLIVHFSERAGGRKLQTIEGVCPFEVVMYGRYREFEWLPGTCTYLEECDWQINRVGSL